ncbi:RNA recognition motif domain [Macleaya cordata]|uniref:RNA recognition motif domain n=1 Tax=Macleaya cordata TaxID=56857 RepID=A0A200R8S7_MACCD|nr:RNA recognition motif domain [Macleaya cordata]
MAENSDKDSETLEEMKNGEEIAKPDIQNTSSSSDSDSDEDAEEDHRFEALEKELAENPSSYDTHIQYIKSLRKLGDIEKLRQARESMNAIFPLTPSMWSEWAKDEASLATGNEAFDAIEKLYERGVHEYLSVSLWCDYLNFVEEHDPSVLGCSPDGILKMRNLFERALTAAGLHIVEGNKIWEAYREFEQTILHSIDHSVSEGKEKQVQRIRSLFHRQLSVPLADSRSTLLAYKAWEAEQGKTYESNSSDFDGIPSHVASAYQKSMEMYNARVYHEEQISRKDASETERLQYFMAYLKFEQSSGDPSRVQILYERAVAEFPVSSDIWLDYTRYLEQTLKVPKIIVDVYSRATKNCPWTGKLWVQYLLSLERNRTSEEELSAVSTYILIGKRILTCEWTHLLQYLDLFLTRIDGLRRRFALAGSTEDILDYAVIRDTFQRAADYLSPHLKNTEGLLLMYAYWARLEWKLGKDLVAARGVWESFLKISGSMLEAWERYVKMEIETGHEDAARSIYKRCYSKRFIGTGSEEICHSWLRFEREFGTLEDYDHAVKKVTPRLEELQLFKSQQELKGFAESVPQKDDNPAKKTSQKRKTGTRSTEEQPTPKRHRGTADNLTQASGMETTQKLTEENDAGSTDPKTNKVETSNEQQIKHSTNKEMYRDQCTAFISNLSFQVNDEHLRSFFGDVGGVTAIRILRDKFTGKSRGLAYVDFANAEQLAAAVAKNKKTLLGKRVSIVRSNPQRNRNRESSGSTKEHGGKRAGTATDGGGTVEGSDSKKSTEVPEESVPPHAASTASHRRGDHFELKGKNTFAVPRTLVRPLGWKKNEPKNDEENEENPKTNDEFRKMLLKK